MAQSRAGIGHVVSAIGALVALISLWLPWISIDLDKVRQMPAFQAGLDAALPSQQLNAEINRFISALLDQLPGSVDGNGWDIMQRTDIVFAIGAALVIGLFLAIALAGADARSTAQLMAAIGVIGLALVLFKLASPGIPSGAEEIIARKQGFIVCLVGWALCAAGAIYEFREPRAGNQWQPAPVPAAVAAEPAPKPLTPQYVPPADASGSVAPPPR